MSLFFRLAETISAQLVQPGARIPLASAPAFFTKLRRVIFLLTWLVSADLTKKEIHQISEILVAQSFLRPFWHEREFGGLHSGDLRTYDDYLDTERLTNCDASGRFIHNKHRIVVLFLVSYKESKVFRRNCGIGVENIVQQLFLPAVASAGQIRSDRESIIAQAMAGLAALLEQPLAVPDVAAQLERRVKTSDHFVTIGVCGRADHLDGALLEGS